MAHFILEYSTNLNADQLAPRQLLGKLIEAAVDTGIFPRAGCRGRAHACTDYYVGDGREEFAFVHLQVRMGSGRSETQMHAARVALRQVLQEHLQPLMDSGGVAASLELCELPEHKENINNLRQYLE